MDAKKIFHSHSYARHPVYEQTTIPEEEGSCIKLLVGRLFVLIGFKVEKNICRIVLFYDSKLLIQLYKEEF